MVRAVQELLPADESVLVAGDAEAFLAVVGVLMVAVLGLFLWLLVRNVRMLRRVGTGAATARPAGRPVASLGERLQELDDLHRRGLISDAERSTARQRALTSP